MGYIGVNMACLNIKFKSFTLCKSYILHAFCSQFIYVFTKPLKLMLQHYIFYYDCPLKKLYRIYSWGLAIINQLKKTVHNKDKLTSQKKFSGFLTNY